jgi:sigma-54 specific flagellar transcriptional regulator A
MSAQELAVTADSSVVKAHGLEAPSVVDCDARTRVRLPTGTSISIRDVIGLVRQVAEHDSTVLILGESGTGKEVAARAIHDLSPRRQRPFVAVNCGAIPAELLESELFGHEKGAFTGAVSARKGRFEIAEGGTLFLDEIGDMSPTMQVKLLRVLQERVFERVGNHVSMKCNVRIVAATHRNLEEAITRQAFREDLFHRINVFPIEMPALRSRIEDLPLLVRDFIAHNIAEGRGRVQLSPRALAALALYRWPGNVRELANLIERLSITSNGRIAEIGDLPQKYRPTDWSDTWTAPPFANQIAASDTMQTEALAISERIERALERDEDTARTQEVDAALLATAAAKVATTPESHTETITMATIHAAIELPADGLDLRAHLLEIERTLVVQALARSDGVVAHAAKLLNLRRTTLVEKLRKLGLLSGEVTTED